VSLETVLYNQIILLIKVSVKTDFCSCRCLFRQFSVKADVFLDRFLPKKTDVCLDMFLLKQVSV